MMGIVTLFYRALPAYIQLVILSLYHFAIICHHVVTYQIIYHLQLKNSIWISHNYFLQRIGEDFTAYFQ